MQFWLDFGLKLRCQLLNDELIKCVAGKLDRIVQSSSAENVEFDNFVSDQVDACEPDAVCI